MLVLDGVYGTSLFGEPVFHEVPTPSVDDVAKLTRALHRRIERFLVAEGRMDRDTEEHEPHDACVAAATAGRRALGPRSGQPLPRVREEPPDVAKDPKKLAARYDGFSLHAGTRVAESSRHRLQKLCRYVARPAIVSHRLTRAPDGRISYSLKRTWSDGSTHVVFDPQTLLERLAALVPRPRRPLVTYHGVLAPASPRRPRIVPEPPPAPACSHTASATPAPKPDPPPTQRILAAVASQRTGDARVAARRNDARPAVA